MPEEAEGLAHEVGSDVVDAVGFGDGFAEPDHAFELPYGDAVAVAADAALRVLGAEFLVLLHEQRARLGGEFGLEGAREADVSLELLGGEFGGHGVVAEPMDVDNVLGEMAVDGFVAFVKDDEEEIEAAHDGRAHVDVGPERGFAVVAPADGVGGREDAGARVERGLDAGFGDGDGLLFHGFVDGDLVANVHLVEFVDGADAIVREHERPRFDGEFTRFFVFDHRRRESCC